MTTIDLKTQIERSIMAFSQGNLRENGIRLLKSLGYSSDRQVTIEPNTFAGFTEIHPPLAGINKQKALVYNWLSVDILFQLTGEDLKQMTQGRLIFDKNRIDNQIIESYLFLAIELKPKDYSRTKLADITREVNKFFAMPVMILFKNGEQLTFSIINRRLHKKDESKDVLEKVTLIKGINIKNPIRAHIEIMFDLSLQELEKIGEIHSFIELHRAWQKTLDISELNKRFYREIADWYFYAVEHVEFPIGTTKDRETRNATNVIRLITRMIFVWFIKEKGLVPDALFIPKQLKEILYFNDPQNSTYYKAILQNLFFATLNTEMGPDRRFRGKNKNPNGLDAHYGISTVFRYEDFFKDPTKGLSLFAGIPFLNGGLFECLDKREEKILVDGFSDDPRNQPIVPDSLFFGDELTVDMTKIYGDKHHNKEKVRGLIRIFDSYKFTIEENTPLDEEIALDPELLGKVFENLLAAFNPETGTTARKQTGSFYTPREIVNYMVDESLIAHLANSLGGNEQNSNEKSLLESKLRHLLAYNNEPHHFIEEEAEQIISAIDKVKVLDPACGSGAFPMGVLHKLVFILNKLDPGNVRWKERQLAKAAEIPDSTIRDQVIEDIEKSFTENELDYGRKLYLIENCIYGVDIQPIAVQIAKLRFFISLVVDQTVSLSKPNLGIRPLPNLESKFVAANALISIEKPQQMLLHNPVIDEKEKRLAEVRNSLFTARTPNTKHKYREMDKQLRLDIADLLKNDGWPNQIASLLADWDPYDQNSSAEYFDSSWMFCVDKGFDIIIGNPPYVGQKGNKEIFQNIALTNFGKKYHQRRMDLFYFFIHLAFNLTHSKSQITFITTNYYVTATYADKLRKDIYMRATIRLLVNLNELKIFESATGQHNLITFFEKGKDNSIETKIISTKQTGFATPEILHSILSGSNSLTEYRMVNQTNLFIGDQYYINLSGGVKSIESKDEISDILSKISTNNATLGNLCHVFQGIVTGADKVSPKNIRQYQIQAEPGQGIFVLDENELKNLHLNEVENKYIRPWYKNSDISRYYCSTKNTQYLIYRSSKHSESNLPNIKKHLDQYKIILVNRNVRAGEVSISEYDEFVKGKRHIDYVMIASSMRAGNFYALSYARDEEEFNGQKLVSPQRSYQNTFCYNEIPWYASADVYYITQQNKTVDLKYLLALLNSKLYFFWLYHRGKRKGEMLELYQKPLSEIPIKVINPKEQLRFVGLVDQILSIKRKDPSFNTSEIENKIDLLVYEIYGLTNEEITIVEGKVSEPKNVIPTEVAINDIADEVSESAIIDNQVQSDYDLYKCNLCGKMVLGHDRESHSKEYHNSQAEWEKLKK